MSTDLTRRIDALERSNRRLRASLTAGLLLGGSLILLGAAEGEAPETIELKDGGGKVRISLQMKGDAPALVMYDRHGDPSIELIVGRDGPEFHLRGDHASSRAALTANRDTTSLVLADRNGKTRAELVVDGKPRSELNLLDEQQRRRLAVSYVRGKSPAVSLFDERGKELWPGGGAPKIVR